jgi:hypothetical protein
LTRSYAILLGHIFREHCFNPSKEWVLLFEYDPRAPMYCVAFKYTAISCVRDQIPITARRALAKNILLHPDQLNVIGFFVSLSPTQQKRGCSMYCYISDNLPIVTEQQMVDPTLTELILTQGGSYIRTGME